MSLTISEAQQRANKTKAEKILRYDTAKLKSYLEKKARREADLLAQLQTIQTKIKIAKDRLNALSGVTATQ
jgi:hypothetical protein